MPTRFIKVGSCYVNPWATTAVTDGYLQDGWCEVILNSGEALKVDAPYEDVVEAIEAACANDDQDPDVIPLLSPVGFAR